MPQILVIDDEENYALMLQNLLEERGFKTEIATHPKDAYELLKQNNFALIVSDYRMPLMDGAAFLKKVRGIHPRMPVFLVSGIMNTAELVKVANLGATRVFEKPLDAEVFVAQILQFVEPESDTGGWEHHPIEGLKRRYKGQHKPAYGPSLSFLSDKTTAGVRWIEQLYYAWQQHPHLLLVQPVGGEGSLAAHQLLKWEDDRRELISVRSLEELASERVTPIIQEALLNDGRPICVSLTINREMLDEEISIVRELIDSSPALDEQPRLRVVLCADRAASADYLDVIEAQLSLNRVHVPDLSGRVADIISYLCMHSEQWLPAPMWPHAYEPGLSARLLGYSWPGNVDQIDHWLRYLGERKPASLDECVFEAFLEDSGLPVSHATFSVENALVESQRLLLIDTARETGGNVIEVLGGMGFDVDGLPEGVSEDDFGLLFPQVL